MPSPLPVFPSFGHGPLRFFFFKALPPTPPLLRVFRPSKKLWKRQLLEMKEKSWRNWKTKLFWTLACSLLERVCETRKWTDRPMCFHSLVTKWRRTDRLIFFGSGWHISHTEIKYPKITADTLDEHKISGQPTKASEEDVLVCACYVTCDFPKDGGR